MENSDKIISILTSIEKWVKFLGIMIIIGLVLSFAIFIYKMDNESEKQIQADYLERLERNR